MKNAHEFLMIMAMGDAYGMKYEYVPHVQDKTAADLFYGPHPKHTGYPVGHYSDDTQMSLANTELLLKNSSPTATDFIEAWLAAFKRDPHQGYSKHMYKVLTESNSVAEFESKLDPKKGTTSGGAMRAGPMGLLPDVEQVKALTKLQAKITHDTVTGVNAALAVALTVHFFHHGGTRKNIDAFLKAHIGENWASDGYAEDPHNGLKIVSQAMSALHQANTLSEVLLTVVNQDAVSDTDTICAIAMVMASRCSELQNDLPPALYDGLEDGAYGSGYLQQMDEEALKAFPASTLYKGRDPPGPGKNINPSQCP